ncbi:MAG: alanine racemase [Candidatus Sericytochromatia bacterium]|nr:alanine racemase [Candidatus Sericytochromatia bacterium]
MVAPRLEPAPQSTEPQVDPRVNAWLEIDLRAVRDNLADIRSHLAPTTQVMAIVKADAYGHGAPYVSQTLLAAGANRLGVATVLEAEQLRHAGITAPILILGPLLATQLDAALNVDAEVMISSAQGARELATAAGRRRLRAKAHVKIDTGMGRVGLQPEHALALIQHWDKIGPVDLVGICTHFAAAEDQPDFTRTQLACFQAVLQGLDVTAIRHAANSAGTLNYPDSHFDLVRPGIALYGAARIPGAPERPVMRLRARLTHIKLAQVGSTLGYGRTYTVARPSTVGILPLGYADGLPRALSNRQDVLVGGKRCPLVGMISMDQCLVDLTGVPAQPGDEVVLLGEQGDERITVHDWADTCNTISYEILCRLGSSRLARFFRS